MRPQLWLSGFMVIASLAIGGAVSAEEGQGDFEKRKAEAVAEIDQRIQKMQEHKTCVSAAANHDALKQCREKMKEWHQEERMEHMERRKGRIDERMKKMQEKKGQ